MPDSMRRSLPQKTLLKTLSNRSAFHTCLLLQNTHALPKAYYQQYGNTSAINPEIVAMTSTPSSSPNQLATPAKAEHQPRSATTANPFLPTPSETTPPTSNATTTDTPPLSTTAATVTATTTPAKKHYVWKPGHGTIEKVDKRTGEIFHLAESTPLAA